MLKISKNQRFLTTESGKPFFWLGDTAWELFSRLTLQEGEEYLQTRKEQGFNVVQAVLLAELDGLRSNISGHLPFLDCDPTRPDEQGGYWQQVDALVAYANRLGMVMALLPTWGDKWNGNWGAGPVVFTPENARVYGMWLAGRYGHADVVWVLGGDRALCSTVHLEIIRAMAAGLREGGAPQLITFHPHGNSGSADFLHCEPWLDFNMRQNGHCPEYGGRYENTRTDYERTPTKPVLDAEPLYEGHPVDFNADKFGISVAADVRRCLYWDLFAGACGHTYGHHSVWQMWRGDDEGVKLPVMTWREALREPGAEQMIHGRRLLESRPFFNRIPDDALLVPQRNRNRVPGAGQRRLCATRDRQGRYAMVYVPVGISFEVALYCLAADRVRAWWYDPRTGGAEEVGVFSGRENFAVKPRTPGEMLDWVLVLDDVAQNYPAPGIGQVLE